MPKPPKRTGPKPPKYCGPKKDTNQAFIRTVRLNDGNEVYLGLYGTTKSRQRYAQIVAQLEAAEAAAKAGLTPKIDLSTTVTITVMVDAYTDYARGYYLSPDGEQTLEVQGLNYALQPLITLYGEMPADNFQPKHLIEIQRSMIPLGMAVSTINSRISRIKRAFRWACAEGIVRPGLYHELTCVHGLRRGRSGAKETKIVVPVPLPVVGATLPWMTPVTATMIQVHFLCGMRSQDVCQIRPVDIDRTGDIWIYRPERFKTKHLGHKRPIAVPPVAQELLLPFLEGRDPYDFIFSPRESLRQKHDQQRKNSTRKTKVYPCELRRSQARPAKTTRVVGFRYDRVSYRNAIVNAIRKAKKNDEIIPHWHPHQLRHAIATYVSSRLGPREAQYYVGHKRLETTKIYDSLQVSDLIGIARRVNDLFDDAGRGDDSRSQSG